MQAGKCRQRNAGREMQPGKCSQASPGTPSAESSRRDRKKEVLHPREYPHTHMGVHKDIQRKRKNLFLQSNGMLFI
jgi:hypothetical protein